MTNKQKILIQACRETGQELGNAINSGTATKQIHARAQKALDDLMRYDKKRK